MGKILCAKEDSHTVVAITDVRPPAARAAIRGADWDYGGLPKDPRAIKNQLVGYVLVCLMRTNRSTHQGPGRVVGALAICKKNVASGSKTNV